MRGKTADRLAFGLALGEASDEVGAGALLVGESSADDEVQSAVGLSVAAAVESAALLLA
jgi:hypothetical protein